MNEQHKYRSTDKMSDLICDNYSLLMVMSRFGLSLGFGDKSVKDVCEAQGVDCPTFLAVANFISEEQYSYSGNESDFSIPALMDYLKRAHTYFLDFNLPAIRRKLIEAIDCSSTNDGNFGIDRGNLLDLHVRNAGAYICQIGRWLYPEVGQGKGGFFVQVTGAPRGILLPGQFVLQIGVGDGGTDRIGVRAFVSDNDDLLLLVHSVFSSPGWLALCLFIWF